jgi:formylmethanofuran dehydrogenase subunit E
MERKFEEEKLEDGYMHCEKCSTVILKGDAHYVSGDRVCEYCLDSYSDEEREEARN